MTADYNTACCHSAAQLCPTLFNPMGCSRPVFPAITVYWSLLKLMSIESMMPPNHLNLLPSIFPIIRVFSNESALCIRWPKYYYSFDKYFRLCRNGHITRVLCRHLINHVTAIYKCEILSELVPYQNKPWAGFGPLAIVYKPQTWSVRNATFYNL